jgi:hypothetical protein
MAIMSVGYLSTAGWSRIDLIGKAAFNAVATVGLLLLGRTVWIRQSKSLSPEQ